MNKPNLLTLVGTSAPRLPLVALPGSSAGPQRPDDSKIAGLQHKIDELEAKLQAQMERPQDQEAVLADTEVLEDAAPALALENQDPTQIEVLPGIDLRRVLI